MYKIYITYSGTKIVRFKKYVGKIDIFINKQLCIFFYQLIHFIILYIKVLKYYY